MQFKIRNGFHIFLIVFVIILIIFAFLCHLTFRCLTLMYIHYPETNQFMMTALVELSSSQKGMLKNSKEENDELL